MKLVWDANAWEDYLWWQGQDRNGNEGIGKPEPLAGYSSRCIDDEHRLVYKIAGAEVRIAACPYHYGG